MNYNFRSKVAKNLRNLIIKNALNPFTNRTNLKSRLRQLVNRYHKELDIKNNARKIKISKNAPAAPAAPPLPPKLSRGISTNSAMGKGPTRRKALVQEANKQTGVSNNILRKINNNSQLKRTVSTGNANVQTLDASLKAKRVPNSIIRKMSLNNKRKYAQVGYRFKSGMFGGYRFERYDPELNRRKTSVFALKSSISKTKNIPSKVSSGFASLTKGIGRRLRKSGEQRKARAIENLARSEQARKNLRERTFVY
jgi:hypothetical protein